MKIDKIKEKIRDIRDFPKKGVVFKDITPLLLDSESFKKSINMLSALLENKKIDKIASMESRGFIFGSALALKLNCGFIPVRKKGKLPWKVFSITYDLEYGMDTLEIHKDAIKKGENILIVDDVLATGGTAMAVAKLIEKAGGNLEGMLFLIELTYLKAREEKFKGYRIYSLLKY